VQGTDVSCWLGEGEEEEGRSLTGERGWRQAPVRATGGSSVARIEARRGPALVLRSTQKQEAPSKLARGRRPAAVCVRCSLVQCAIAGGRWRLAGVAIRAVAGEREERAIMVVEVLARRKEKKKRRAPRALIVEKAREGLKGEQDLAPVAVVALLTTRCAKRAQNKGAGALPVGRPLLQCTF
jgi:hypothetical protein